MHEIVLRRTGSIVVALVCLSVTFNSVFTDKDKLLVLIRLLVTIVQVLGLRLRFL